MKRIDMDVSIAINGVKTEDFFDLEEFSQIIDEPLESIVSGDVEVFLGTIWFEFDNECEEESIQKLVEQQMSSMDDKDYFETLILQGNCSPCETKICRWLLEKNQGRRLIAINFIFEVLEW